MTPSLQCVDVARQQRKHARMIQPPYLIFIGSARDALAAKTGHGIVDWRPGRALAQMRLPGCAADLGIPDMSVMEAAAAGARTFVLGTVSPGGVLPDAWTGIICDALEHGMDVASGLHTPLESFPAIAAAARQHGRQLFDVRLPGRQFAVGSGKPRRHREGRERGGQQSGGLSPSHETTNW